MRFALLFLALPLAASNWYVRPDGGTATQCTGRADAAYPGTGSAQPCAFKNPYYLWTNDPVGAPETPAWKIAGGDTVIIKNGDYRMGWKGMENVAGNAWNYLGCVGNNQNCYNPTIPAGSAGAPTRIVGEAWQSGCATKPILRGAGGVQPVLNLNGAAYVELNCLELTDNAQCVMGKSAADVYPCGQYTTDHAYFALQTSLATNHLTLSYLDIHGFAAAGINGAVGGSVAADHLRISGNGNMGWNFDPGGGQASTGPLSVTYSTVEWSGCVEQYPIVATLPIMWCGDNAGSGHSGDAFGFVDFTGDVTLDHVISRYNTQDGLDALYMKSTDHLTVTNGQYYGNEGQQVKTGGSALMDVRNNVIISGCERMKSDFAGMPNPGAWQSGMAGYCRAGDLIALIFKPGSTMNFENNTLVGYNTTLLDVACTNVVDTWTSTARADWQGNSDSSAALDGASRYLSTTFPLQYVSETGSLYVGTTQQRVGHVYVAGSAVAANRYRITAVNTDTDVITRIYSQPANGTKVRFATVDGGTLPAPLVADTYYYVVGTGTAGFSVAETPGGSAIDLTSAGAGTIYADLDCSGAKCGWYWTDGATRLDMDPATTTPPTSATVKLTYYYTSHCDGASLSFRNNLVRGYRRIGYTGDPTVWYSFLAAPSIGIAPELRANNAYCGVSRADTGNNRAGSTETYQATTCPGTWFAGEPASMLDYTTIDLVDPRLAAGSPAIDAGVTIGAVLTDIIGTARPQGAAYDLGAYEWVVSGAAPRNVVSGKSSVQGKVSVP